MTPSLFIWREAELSNCGKYRYSLLRKWDNRRACFVAVLLNPSIADAYVDDPTIRKLIGFGQRWGYGSVLVLNLFAVRATDPREMLAASDPVGPMNTFENLKHKIAESGAAFVLAGWGKHAGERGVTAKRELPFLHYLRLNKDGSPEHPLYVPYDTIPQRLEMA